MDTPTPTHGDDGETETYGQRLFGCTFDGGCQEPRFLIFRSLQLVSVFNTLNDLAT